MKQELKYKDITEKISSMIPRSVKSSNPCYSVIQTRYKGHGGVPIAIGMKVASKLGSGSEFIIFLPV